MSNIDPDWPVWANPLIWDLRSCGRCKRHVILGGTAAGLARPASEMAILGVLEAILGDFRVIMANLRVKYTQLPMCISVCTASMGTGERNGVFWCISGNTDNGSWTPDRSFWHLDSRMAIWRHWPGSVLGAPSWVDIPDSIRRDMKPRIPAGVTQIGHPGFHTQGHEIRISHLGHPSWDSGISHKPPWSGKIAFSVNLHQLD